MKNKKPIKLVFHVYFCRVLCFHSPYHKTRMICLTRDKSAYQHRDSKKRGPGPQVAKGSGHTDTQINSMLYLYKGCPTGPLDEVKIFRYPQEFRGKFLKSAHFFTHRGPQLTRLKKCSFFFFEFLNIHTIL